MSIIRRRGLGSPSIFDDIFDRNFFDDANYSSSRSTMPSVNILEHEKEFKVEMAAPGMKKKDFKIEVNNNVLSIYSESKQEDKSGEDNDRYTRREFSYQSFRRTFTLPDSVDEDNIEATYEDGVLKIRIPKKEDAGKKEARSIQIK